MRVTIHKRSHVFAGFRGIALPDLYTAVPFLHGNSRPVGAERQPETAAVMLAETKDLLARRGVPQANRAVAADGDDTCTVGAEGNVIDIRRMSRQGHELRPVAASQTLIALSVPSPIRDWELQSMELTETIRWLSGLKAKRMKGNL